MYFGIGKSRDVTCLAYRTAPRDQLVTTSTTRTTLFRGIANAWTGVDMSNSLFPEVVPEIDANPEHKRLKPVHASTTASSSSAMLEQARLDTLVTTRATCTIRRACRDEPSGI